uniref:Uncharacterized protein n=1 Tax=Rhizophora mucronata TaxID=61149 RepID=A0A2P2QVZ1_RHIMU
MAYKLIFEPQQQVQSCILLQLLRLCIIWGYIFLLVFWTTVCYA